MSNQNPGALRRFIYSFTDLLAMPRALWFVIGAFVLESMAYFGVLTVMSSYLSTDLMWGDVKAGITVSLFTMCITLFMLGAGSWAEGMGLRKAILLALGIATVGRFLYSLAPQWGGGLAVLAVLVALFVVAIGEGILQPVCYSGVKQYTNEKTSSMGYAMIYAIMNLGIVGAGALSAWLRPAVQDMKKGLSVAEPGSVAGFFSGISGSGIQAVNWLFTGVTALVFVLFLVFMTKKAESQKLRPDSSAESEARIKMPIRDRVKSYFAEGPFTNTRFIFFIFMLLPVRTLFAHQWLTFPQYIMRAYDKGVADRMEWLVNWINPAIIFIGVPIITALTRRMDVYTVMMLGSLVSAAPTFLLCAGPSLSLLISYFVFFSIGEALWSARFLEYASELAPAGRVSQYMGLANVPWLLAKGTTGFYSGYMLATYCPEGLPPAEQQTGTLWLVYGCVAMTTPIGLWLARHWVRAGLNTKSSAKA